MRDKFYKAVQSFSTAIIRPVMFMAVAGLIIAIASIFNLEVMPEFLNTIGGFLNTVLLDGIISQLPVIFTIGLAGGLAKDNKGEAAILGILTFMMYLFANNFWLGHTNNLAEMGEFGLAGTGQAEVLGVQVVDMGVFIGIILGILVGYIHNKYKDVKLHEYLSPYEGTRFAFLILIAIASILGIVTTYIWPPVNIMLVNLVEWLSTLGAVGFFLYGVINRLALPFGLHHLLWVPIGYSPLGGVAEIAGETVAGANNIWFAQMANIETINALHPSVGYLANFGALALPVGIALALISTAKKENKKALTGILIPAVMSAMLAGITEPIEFIFLFTAPVLWLAHAVVYGFGLWLANITGLRLVVTHLIDTILHSIVIPVELGRQWLVPIIFVVLVIIEFGIFKVMIEKLDLNTIGRKDILSEDSGTDEENEFADSDSVTNINNKHIINGLGGVENISEVNNCYTRLRIDVINADKIDKDTLNKYPSSGVVTTGNHVQIIIGPGKVDKVRASLDKDIMNTLNNA